MTLDTHTPRRVTTDHGAERHAFVYSGRESTVKTHRNWWSQNRALRNSFWALVYMVLEEMGVEPGPQRCGVAVCLTEAVVQTESNS